MKKKMIISASAFMLSIVSLFAITFNSAALDAKVLRPGVSKLTSVSTFDSSSFFQRAASKTSANDYNSSRSTRSANPTTEVSKATAGGSNIAKAAGDATACEGPGTPADCKKACEDGNGTYDPSVGHIGGCSGYGGNMADLNFGNDIAILDEKLSSFVDGGDEENNVEEFFGSARISNSNTGGSNVAKAAGKDQDCKGSPSQANLDQCKKICEAGNGTHSGGEVGVSLGTCKGYQGLSSLNFGDDILVLDEKLSSFVDGGDEENNVEEFFGSAQIAQSNVNFIEFLVSKNYISKSSKSKALDAVKGITITEGVKADAVELLVSKGLVSKFVKLQALDAVRGFTVSKATTHGIFDPNDPNGQHIYKADGGPEENNVEEFFGSAKVSKSTEDIINLFISKGLISKSSKSKAFDALQGVDVSKAAQEIINVSKNANNAKQVLKLSEKFEKYYGLDFSAAEKKDLVEVQKFCQKVNAIPGLAEGQDVSKLFYQTPVSKIYESDISKGVDVSKGVESIKYIQDSVKIDSVKDIEDSVKYEHSKETDSVKNDVSKIYESDSVKNIEDSVKSEQSEAVIKYLQQKADQEAEAKRIEQEKEEAMKYINALR